MLNYGLSFNYRQRLNIQAFRQALIQAYENDDPAPNAHRGEAQYLLIEYKSPGGSTQPFLIPSQAVWSSNLFSERTFTDPKDLPRVYLRITKNESETSKHAGKDYNFTLAGFKPFSESDKSKRFRRKIDEPDTDGKRWKWLDISYGDLQAGEEVDIDEDGKEETIIADQTGVILGAMDSQEGEIDPEQENQGITGEYTSQLSDPNKPDISVFKRIENNSNIINKRNSSATEDFFQILRLKNITPEVRQQVKEGDELDEDNKILKIKTPLIKGKHEAWITPWRKE